MELGFQEGGEARVIVGGGVRYIGDGVLRAQYRQDSFGQKGEVFLRFYDDTANDPLQYIAGFEDIAGKGRWVVIGGLDLSEEEPWGEEIGLRQREPGGSRWLRAGTAVIPAIRSRA